MAKVRKASSAEKRIFSSVFTSPALVHTIPTPIATPLVGYSEPGQNFGGPFDSRTADLVPGYADVQRNNAWSIVTRYFTLPLHSPLACHQSTCQEDVWHPKKQQTSDIIREVELVCAGDLTEGNTNSRETLVEWYSHEVWSHFGTYMQPALLRIWDTRVLQSESIATLLKTAQALRIAQQAYYAPLNFILPCCLRVQAEDIRNAKKYVKNAKAKFCKNLQMLFDQTISFARFYNTLSFAIYDAASEYASDSKFHPGQETDLENFSRKCRDLAEVLDNLHDVGLGGTTSQKALARAMDRVLADHMESDEVAVDWFEKSSVTVSLKEWVESRFERFGRWAVSKLEAEGSFSDTTEPRDTQATETRYWQEIAIGRLGQLRALDLFEFVKQWDQSIGAIRDLKEYITTPVARSHLAITFTGQLHNRLLLPAITTLDILDFYISVIKVFTELDSKGVLLGRVARPIRSYLKHRDDTVPIIVESCLAEFDEEGDPVNTTNDVCMSIAIEMNNPAGAITSEDYELDWADLNWVPEPLDAEPGYRKVKSDDTLSYLLTLFDHEEFIKELQTILADHLLRSEDTECEREIQLVELFKARFGDDKLQACEVMLKDMQDSKRISTTINDKNHPSLTLSKPSANFDTKILSSFFWPSLREDDFRMPRDIVSLQEFYANRFEKIKENRKLQWLNALGHATVTLDLEDRSITERNVQTYQVSVIEAFEEPNLQPGGGPVTRTVEKLEEDLEMDETLVRSALTFWVGKLVLREAAPDTFTLLERLDESTENQEAAAAAAAEEDTGIGAVKSQQDRFGEKKEFYAQFVAMMLTNQGNKPTTQILMMMKMMLPDGFPFSEEDLREFLGDLVNQGALIKTGADVYGVRK